MQHTNVKEYNTNWETTPSLRDQQQSNISESLAIITNWETTPSLWDLRLATDVEDQLLATDVEKEQLAHRIKD